jgi:bifunctional DNA-binding transcriptional regulator/antitoxin component of YhaV-PrlF toxin-antitoxin module
MPKLAENGQIQVPDSVIRFLEIHPGDEIEFEIEGTDVVLRKNKSAPRKLRSFVGYLSHLKGRDSDDIVNELRGNPDDFGD